jgi:EAL domain-containing protein (putative c-di-GMP-specific phosphodiesterase class I)
VLVYQFLAAISDPTEKAIQAGQGDIRLDEAYLIDDTLALSLEDIQRKDSEFHVQRLDEIPWDFGKQAYWIRLALNNLNDHKVDLVSHFSNPMIEQLNIYQVSPAGRVVETALGWQVEHLTKKARSLPSYEFSLEENSSTQLYIRIATEGISRTPIGIYAKEDFSKLVSLSYLIWGSFVGILITMSLYNLVLFWGLKDTVYLAYIGYILSVLMMLGVVMGFGHYIWPEAIIRLLRDNIVAVNISLIVSSMLFALSFFNVKQNETRIVRASIYYVAYLVIFAFISLFLPEYIAAPIYFVSMIFLYPLAVMMLTQQAKHNLHWAWLYIVSWLPLLVGGGVQPMELTGVIESSFLVHHSLMIGVLFEIVLMAMALAHRMQFKKERALYRATHEPDTNLANINLLESKASFLIQKNIDFSIAIIEIENFSTLLPYISNNDNNDLMLMLAKSIERKLYFEDNVIELEIKNKRTIKIAKINEGTFSFIMEITSMPIKEKERINKKLKFLTEDMKNGAQVGDLLINLSVNIGVSLVESQDYMPFSEILKQAYRALEQGKSKGVVCSFYQPEQAVNVAQRLTMAADLQKALRNNRLQLFHQPQINLATNRIDGSEALIRWNHPEHGFIPPDTFIRLAEDTGIINELTLWVIETACKNLEELIAQGYQGHNVSVNISGKDITEPYFLSNVRAIFEKYDFPLSCLTFELTESVMVSDFLHLSQTMKQLSVMGVQVAIDDYGTGYSSLFYISQLPFNEIKIDKSFVMNIENSDTDLTIVRTTIEMAKSLGLKIVAEGIENKAVEDILKTHNCYLAQGYFYSKPVDFKRYLSLLESRGNR